MIDKKMEISWGTSYKHFSIMFMILCSLCSTVELFAQDWERGTIKDNWGDITGYAYSQYTVGVAHKEKDISVVVGFAYSTTEAQLRNVLVIYSTTVGDFDFHPAASFSSESVTISLRSNDITTKYKGNTVSSQGNYNKVAIVIMDSELIRKLQSSGQWEMLIE